MSKGAKRSGNNYLIMAVAIVIVIKVWIKFKRPAGVVNQHTNESSLNSTHEAKCLCERWISVAIVNCFFLSIGCRFDYADEQLSVSIFIVVVCHRRRRRGFTLFECVCVVFDSAQ